MRIADLRASVRTTQRDSVRDRPAPPKPPKPGKGVKRESEEDRAIKAEKQALAQHTTSLLAGKSKKPYIRPGERAERKSGGLFVQLMLVMIVVAGTAYALDPTIVPAEWTAKAHELIAKYVKL